MMNLIVILIVFEFGYLLRFTADLMPNFFKPFLQECTIIIMRFSIPSDHCPTVPFYWFALEDASYIFEGMSYLALLLFHLKNFRSPLKLEEVERAYSLIKSDCLDFQYE